MSGARLPDEGWKNVIDRLAELLLPEAGEQVMVTLLDVWEWRDRKKLAPVVRTQILDMSAEPFAEAVDRQDWRRALTVKIAAEREADELGPKFTERLVARRRRRRAEAWRSKPPPGLCQDAGRHVGASAPASGHREGRARPAGRSTAGASSGDDGPSSDGEPARPAAPRRSELRPVGHALEAFLNEVAPPGAHVPSFSGSATVAPHPRRQAAGPFTFGQLAPHLAGPNRLAASERLSSKLRDEAWDAIAADADRRHAVDRGWSA